MSQRSCDSHLSPLNDRDLSTEVESSLKDIDQWRSSSKDRSGQFSAIVKGERSRDRVIPCLDIKEMLSKFDIAFSEPDLTTPLIMPVIEKAKEIIKEDKLESDPTLWEGKSDYFKVKNPSELFKLGQTFVNEYKQGRKVFGISTVEQDKFSASTCWGLASAMNFMINKRSVIITDNIGQQYNDLLSDAESYTLSMDEYGVELRGKRINGITIFEVKELIEIIFTLSSSALNKFFQDFTYQCGALFIQLPELKLINSKRHLYVPIFESLNSISYVVDKTADMRKLDATCKYFGKYGIDTLGVIFGREEIEF